MPSYHEEKPLHTTWGVTSGCTAAPCVLTLCDILQIILLFCYCVTAAITVSETSSNAINQIEKNEMGGDCSTYGEKRGAYRILVRRPEGSRRLGRPRRRWEDNIKMDLQDVGRVHGLD
jgi:hypothetical protein